MPTARQPDPPSGIELDGRFPIGRDPREMTRAELQALGHGKKPLLRVIRARCLDCCCYQESEVEVYGSPVRQLAVSHGNGPVQ